MKENLYTRSLIIFVGLSLLIIGCGKTSNGTNPEISEGMVEYAVSFPYSEEANVMESILPEKMTMKFKNNNYYTELSTYGGVFKTNFISNYEEQKFTQLLKIFKKRIACQYDEAGISGFLEQFPPLTIVKTEETDTIAGYLCKKAIGTLGNDTEHPMTIYYTDAIKILNPNWCTMFKDIDGVLMAYEIEQFNLRMRLEAREVVKKDISDKLFTLSPDYEAVDGEVISAEISKLLDSFSLQ